MFGFDQLIDCASRGDAAGGNAPDALRLLLSRRFDVVMDRR
jgi:hypothetical protein